MSSKNFRYSHIYSAVDGKTPSADTLYTAEIAINAYPHNEHLFIKNSSGDVVSFETVEQTDAKLALKLDASAFTASSAVTSGDTNPVQGGAVYEVITENELVIANALNALDVKKLDASAYTTTSSATEIADALAEKLDIDDFDAYSGAVDTILSDKQDTLTAGTGIDITNNVISVTGGSGGVTSGEVQTMIDESISGKVDNSVYTAYTASTDTALGNKQDVSGMTAYTQTTAFTGHTADTTIHHTATSAVTSGSTDVLTSGGAYSQLGGLKFIQLSQAQYDALSPNYDANTVYIIVN